MSIPLGILKTKSLLDSLLALTPGSETLNISLVNTRSLTLTILSQIKLKLNIV